MTKSPIGSGLRCLLAIAKIHGIPVDPGALMHEFSPSGGDLDAVSILRAAIRINLKATLSSLNWRRIRALPLPVICSLKDEGWVAIIQVKTIEDGEVQILVFDPSTNDVEIMTVEEAKQRLTGDVIMLAPGGNSDRGRKIKFGFGWFMPVIKKYQTHFVEILLASLVINILGLAMPLYFQIIMDKVLVHDAPVTLRVVTYGIILVIVFNFLLEMLRTYVLQHTACRIDVQLGSTLFGHMLRLPQSYFDARPVGLTVARAC